MIIKWRPHTEKPEEELTAVLLATHDDEGVPFLLGIYTYRATTTSDYAPAGWWSECTGAPAPRAFFWTLESELLEAMP